VGRRERVKEERADPTYVITTERDNTCDEMSVQVGEGPCGQPEMTEARQKRGTYELGSLN